MLNQPTQSIINLYDKYGAMLYGIALRIAPTEKEAAQILLTTLEKAQEQNVVENNKYCICTTLIKLIIAKARQQLNGQFNHHDLPSLFSKNPLLYKIFIENKTISQLCNEINLTSEEVGKKIRYELNAIRIAQKEAAAGLLHPVD